MNYVCRYKLLPLVHVHKCAWVDIIKLFKPMIFCWRLLSNVSNRGQSYTKKTILLPISTHLAIDILNIFTLGRLLRQQFLLTSDGNSETLVYTCMFLCIDHWRFVVLDISTVDSWLSFTTIFNTSIIEPFPHLFIIIKLTAGNDNLFVYMNYQLRVTLVNYIYMILHLQIINVPDVMHFQSK